MTFTTEPTVVLETEKRSGLFMRLAKRPIAVVSAIILLGFVVCAVIPWSWLPHNPTTGNQADRFLKPFFLNGGSTDHLLGTDALGQDILSMVLAGSRATLLIVVFAAAIGLVIGVVAGLAAGYFGGWVDAVVMRLADIQLAFPAIVLVIAIVAAFGPNMTNLIVILGIIGWAPYARLVRGTVLSLKEKDFVEAARITGVGTGRIMRKHLLPNTTTSIVVYLTSDMASLALLEASLSFLGLGVQPPNPSWGLLISQGKQYIYDAWWVSVMPGIAIVLFVLALNFLGDEIRDALDPTSRRAA